MAEVIARGLLEPESVVTQSITGAWVNSHHIPVEKGKPAENYSEQILHVSSVWWLDLNARFGDKQGVPYDVPLRPAVRMIRERRATFHFNIAVSVRGEPCLQHTLRSPDLEPGQWVDVVLPPIVVSSDDGPSDNLVQVHISNTQGHKGGFSFDAALLLLPENHMPPK
eukprot:m.17236 g.17236  ORF g.17236 m.17236 type:complete len:167 (-) comp5422_c0_seq1:54-554(-)